MTATTPERGGIARWRTVIAAAAGVIVTAIGALAAAFGLIVGPVAIILFVAAWMLVPTSERLVRRLAINGAIGLGVVPLLWWISWPRWGGLGHAAVALAVLSGALVAWAIGNRRGPRALLPTLGRSDWLPAAVTLFCGWFFLPFLTFSSGKASAGLLLQGFADDNVAHFDMFEMIRKFDVTGSGWPASPDGTPYAYVNYPQHFHSLVAFFAELLKGDRVGTVDVETGLFGLGTAITLTVAIVTLVSVIASLEVFRNRVTLAAVATVGVISFVLLGFGATSLSFGFPGFLLAVIGAAASILIGVSSRKTTIVDLIASGALVVLVAHSWSLLGPPAAVGFGALIIRLPWHEVQARVSTFVSSAVVIVFVVISVGFAASLVFSATAGAGSPAAALGTPGGVMAVSLPLVFALGFGIIGLGYVQFHRWRDSREDWTIAPFAIVISIATLVGVVELVGLIIVQYHRAGDMSYFQYKLASGLTTIECVLAIVLICILVSGQTSTATSHYRAPRVVVAVVFSAAILAYAGLPLGLGPSTTSMIDPGLVFRRTIKTAALAPDARSDRILAGASTMADAPCSRPIFFDPESSEGMYASNQWAMSFSGTWNEGASKLTSYIFDRSGYRSPAELSQTVAGLLEGHADRCVIVMPNVREMLDASILDIYGAQLITAKSSG